jgi:hypothetical protein
MGMPTEDNKNYSLNFAEDQFFIAEDHYNTWCMTRQFKNEYENGDIIIWRK